MSFEQVKSAIEGYLETKKELTEVKDLINENKGCVSMTMYNDLTGLEGKNFGPIGYLENEYDAVKRKIKTANRIIVSGSTGNVTVKNRNNHN